MFKQNETSPSPGEVFYVKKCLHLLMTQLIFIPIFIFTFFVAPEKDAEDFDRELDDIARDFKVNIMDESKCRRLEGDAEDISKEIQEELDNQPENPERLRELKREADALEVYINCVGLSASNIPTIEQFELANQRVKAMITVVAAGKYCVTIQKVKINEYVCYMMKNSTTFNYTVSYKWSSPSGMNSGYGDQGVPRNCVRQFFNNRDSPEVQTINVYGISCKTFN